MAGRPFWVNGNEATAEKDMAEPKTLWYNFPVTASYTGTEGRCSTWRYFYL